MHSTNTDLILVNDFDRRKDTEPIFQKMVTSNWRGLFLYTLPYEIGIESALVAVAAFGSIPLIFEIDTLLWYSLFFQLHQKRGFGKVILWSFIFLFRPSIPSPPSDKLHIKELFGRYIYYIHRWRGKDPTESDITFKK